MQKLIHLDNEDNFELPDGVETYGDHNTMPTPYREVEYHEYVKQRSAYAPQFIDSRQVTEVNGDKRFHGMVIEWFHDCAFALCLPNNWKPVDGGIEYSEPIRYFKIGCQHEYRAMDEDTRKKRGIPHYGRCWHVDECQKCGHVNSYDSSD